MLEVTVVGLSADAVRMLRRFKDKYDLLFDPASDHARTLGMQYGTLKGDAISTRERDTVVVGQDGVVRLAYRKVTAKGHAAAVLADVRRLRDQGVL